MAKGLKVVYLAHENKLLHWLQPGYVCYGLEDLVLIMDALTNGPDDKRCSMPMID